MFYYLFILFMRIPCKMVPSGNRIRIKQNLCCVKIRLEPIDRCSIQARMYTAAIVTKHDCLKNPPPLLFARNKYRALSPNSSLLVALWKQTGMVGYLYCFCPCASSASRIACVLNVVSLSRSWASCCCRALTKKWK